MDFERGDYKEAVKSFMEAISENPEHREAKLELKKATERYLSQRDSKNGSG